MASCNIHNYDNPTRIAHASILLQMDYVSLLPKVVNATLVTVTEGALSSLVTLVIEEATEESDLLVVVAVLRRTNAVPALVQVLASPKLTSFTTYSSATQCPRGKN